MQASLGAPTVCRTVCLGVHTQVRAFGEHAGMKTRHMWHVRADGRGHLCAFPGSESSGCAPRCTRGRGQWGDVGRQGQVGCKHPWRCGYTQGMLTGVDIHRRCSQVWMHTGGMLSPPHPLPQPSPVPGASGAPPPRRRPPRPAPLRPAARPAPRGLGGGRRAARAGGGKGNGPGAPSPPAAARRRSWGAAGAELGRGALRTAPHRTACPQPRR